MDFSLEVLVAWILVVWTLIFLRVQGVRFALTFLSFFRLFLCFRLAAPGIFVRFFFMCCVGGCSSRVPGLVHVPDPVPDPSGHVSNPVADPVSDPVPNLVPPNRSSVSIPIPVPIPITVSTPVSVPITSIRDPALSPIAFFIPNSYHHYNLGHYSPSGLSPVFLIF